MTVTSTALRASYAGTGTTGPFPYPFRILSATDLTVMVTSPSGGTTTLNYPADYSVSGVGNRSGGSVTLTSALSVGASVILLRDMDFTQPASLRNQAQYFPETIEDQLDRSVMLSQQIEAGSVRLPSTVDPSLVSSLLPSPDANRALFWNSAGTALETRIIDGTIAVVLPGSGRTVANLSDYLANNAVANVRDYNAKGDGSTNDSAAIQAAFNTGLTVEFPAGTYRCNNLTSNTAFQAFVGRGKVILKKNANGPLWTNTGDWNVAHHIGLYGDASTPVFTGDNWVWSGQHPRLWNCSSQWAYGRAGKFTNAGVGIYGSNTIWQTADTSATGWDLEIGTSGTATLYHELHGIYTSQATGGILLTDVGGTSIVGGQIGKLYFKAGTLPAGVGVNKVMGTRITGDCTVEISNTIMTGVAHSAHAVTFAVGTSGCIWDGVISLGGTITNNGNVTNRIIRETSTGSTSKILYGPDTSKALMEMDNGAAGDGHFRFPSVRVPNNIGSLVVENAAGGSGWDISVNAAGDTFVTSRTAGRSTVVTVLGAGGTWRVDTAGGTWLKVNDTGVGLNGNAPVAKAAAITAPTAPSAGYVQAEATSMKTAVDAIRVALQNLGVTL